LVSDVARWRALAGAGEHAAWARDQEWINHFRRGGAVLAIPSPVWRI